MQITAQTYLIILPMVFLAAVIDSISGGGGLISMPAYTMAGLNYDFAAGNNKFSSTFATAVATWRYYKGGRIKKKPALFAIIGSLPGSWLGTRTAMYLGNDIMNRFMLIAIPVIGVFVFLNKNTRDESREMTGRDYFLCVLIGLGTGFYDGLFGPGTGTFLILLFTYLTGMDLVTASATAKPVNLASNIASLITRLAAGNVILAIGIPAVVFSMTGGWLGSRLALAKGARVVRYMMLVVLALLTIKLAAQLLA